MTASKGRQLKEAGTKGQNKLLGKAWTGMASQKIGDLTGIGGLRCLVLDVLVNPPQTVRFILKAVGGSNDSGRCSFFHRHTLGFLSNHEKLDDIFPGDMAATAGI